MVLRWRDLSILAIGLLWVGACTPADYRDGVEGFSQAVSTTAELGEPLAQGARQAMQNQMLRRLDKIDARTVFPADGCRIDGAEHRPGDCALLIAGLKVGNAGATPEMAALKKYARTLSAVVADQTCATLQADIADLAGAIDDIAKHAGSTTPAGPIGQIVSAVGCALSDEERLRILRTSTAAADGSIQKIVPLVADVYDAFYMDALNEAHTQALAAIRDYEMADAAFRSSASQTDLARGKARLLDAISLLNVVDRAKSAPPRPLVLKIAQLHQALRDDLKSPTVNLARILRDSQVFVGQAASVATAAEALSRMESAPPRD